MKLIPHLKKGLNIFIKDIRMMAISFLILPMALALVYGNMQRNLFEGKAHPTGQVKAIFQFNVNTDRGAVFKEILLQKEVRDFILSDGQDPEYTVIISDDFKTAEIKGQDEGSVHFVMLRNFLETVLNNFNRYESMESIINGLNLSEGQEQSLMKEVLDALGSRDNSGPARETIIEGYKTLGSVEYYTISMFSFTSLILIITMAAYFYKEVKEGIVKRSLSTPNNRRDFFLGFILNSFLVSIIISTIYVFVNRARGVAFSGNPLNLALIILLQGLLCASAVGAVISFIKKETTANMVMNLIFIVPSMFGGVFFYTEVIGSSVMKRIMSSVPNALILNSYKGLAITGGLTGVEGEIISMAVLSIVLLALSLVKIQWKWEV